MENKFKIKPLTKSQIIISFDRLTRFKPTEDKYLRVFKDIITSNLIYPKYKKDELNLIDYDVLVNIVEDIFKVSFESMNIELNGDFSINQKLLKYEQSVFDFDKNVQKLLENKINYSAILGIIDSTLFHKPPYKDDLPLNLKWLKSLSQDVNQVENRKETCLKYPLEKIVLVEGITEEILLPKLAKMCGVDFDKAGIHVISAGGKNQVVKIFYQFANILKLPMFVLLDSDAIENYEEITPKFRQNDKVHVLKSGEFEDTIPLNLIKRTLNGQFKNYFSIAIEDLRQDLPMTKILEDIYKSHRLEFKKAEFASLVDQNISGIKDVSEEILAVVEELSRVI